MSRRISLLTTLFAPLLASCAAAPAPAPASTSQAPASAAAPAPAPVESAEPAPAPSAAEQDPAPPAAEPAPEPAPPEPKLSSSPRAIITASEVAFVINYPGSDPSQTAQQSCAEQAKDDLAKLAACKSKARDEFLADVIHFKKSESGKWSWLVYKRKGSNLSEVYSAPIDFGEETDKTITVQIKGGEGTRPLFKGSPKFVVTVPNDYSIELQDPRLGRLVYDAKVGLVGH